MRCEAVRRAAAAKARRTYLDVSATHQHHPTRHLAAVNGGPSPGQPAGRPRTIYVTTPPPFQLPCQCQLHLPCVPTSDRCRLHWPAERVGAHLAFTGCGLHRRPSGSLLRRRLSRRLRLLLSGSLAQLSRLLRPPLQRPVGVLPCNTSSNLRPVGGAVRTERAEWFTPEEIDT